MKLNIATLSLLLGMVFAHNAQADVIFGHSCSGVPATGGPVPTPFGLACETVIIRIEFEQFLDPPPEPNPLPACPNCAFAEIIDIPGLDLQNVEVPSEFAMASRLQSGANLPLSAVDNPQIPNLVLTYVGAQTIAGQTDIGLLKLTVDDWPEEIVELNYHARAFDGNGNLVTNSGSIAIVPAPPVPSLSPLAIALLGTLLGFAGWRRLRA